VSDFIKIHSVMLEMEHADEDTIFPLCIYEDMCLWWYDGKSCFILHSYM